MKSIKKFLNCAIATFVLIGVCSITVKSQSTENPTLTDPEIASVAVTANQVDVNYGKLALKRSDNSEVKKFAQTMIRDHSGVIDQAVALATKLNVKPKDNYLTQQLLQDEKETRKKLKSLRGKKFDKAYIDNEVAYHEAVITVVKEVLIPQAQDPELKALLVTVAPVLEHHLNMVKETQENFQ